MKVAKEDIENSQVVLNIEMESEEVDKSLEDAYRRIVKKANIPGFRKGKAPRNILEQYVGKGALMEEALEHMLPEACHQAIKEQKVEAISKPQVELISVDPVNFKATVPVRPKVKLGDYKKIRVEAEPVEVTEEQVDQAINELRQQQAAWAPVERPVQFGDVIGMAIQSCVDGKELVNEKNAPYRVIKDFNMPLPGFPERLEGAVKEEEREFTLPFPDDYPGGVFKGKECTFKVKVLEIKEQELPEVDNEFAKSMGVDCETVPALRKKVQEDLRKRAEALEQSRFADKAMQMAVDSAEVEYPPVLLDAEIDRMLRQQEEQLQRSGHGMEDYLKETSKTLEQLKEDFRPTATDRLLRSLVLGQLADEEEVSVTPEEIDSEVEKMSNDAGGKAEEVRKFFNLPPARNSLENSIIARKAVNRLTDIANGSDEVTESTTDEEPSIGPQTGTEANP